MESLFEASKYHSYYPHDGNYYTNHYPILWDNIDRFLHEYSDADIDYNLVIRFDVKSNIMDNSDNLKIHDEFGEKYAQITIIHQRKGIYAPNIIKDYRDEDDQKMVEYLKPHWEYLKKLWKPISEE